MVISTGTLEDLCLAQLFLRKAVVREALAQLRLSNEDQKFTHMMELFPQDEVVDKIDRFY